MYIRVMNFKPFDRGAVRGFFDLGYGGLTIKSCRLMTGNNGLWFSFPQQKAEEDGEIKYYDQMFLSSLEREHVRKLVLLDLQHQGHIEGPKTEKNPPQRRQPAQRQRAFEGENIDEYYTQPGRDDIPF